MLDQRGVERGWGDAEDHGGIGVGGGTLLGVHHFLFKDAQERGEVFLLQALSLADQLEQTAGALEVVSEMAELGDALLLGTPRHLLEHFLLVIARTKGSEWRGIVVTRGRVETLEERLATGNADVDPVVVGCLEGFEGELGELGREVGGFDGEGLLDDVEGDQIGGIGGLLLESIEQSLQSVLGELVGRLCLAVVVLQPCEIALFQIILDLLEIFQGRLGNDKEISGWRDIPWGGDLIIIREEAHMGCGDVSFDSHLTTI